MGEPTEDRKEIDARIEISVVDGKLQAEIEAVDDEENAAVVLVKFIGVHIHEISNMAQREHQQRKELEASLSKKSEIKAPAVGLVGADGKRLN